MGRTALGLRLALRLGLMLALALGLGAGCGGAAAGPADAGPPGQDAPRDLALPADAADDAPEMDGAADGPASDGAREGGATEGGAADGPGEGGAHDGGADAAVDGGCGPVSLLANGGFEAGSDSWTEQSTGGYDLVYAATDLPLAPQAGGYAAWLGGYDNAADLLWQEVAVPVGATTLRLTGYRAITTDEGGTYAWDFVRVELRDPSGAVLETLLTYSNVDSTDGWQAFQTTAQSPHAGTTVRLALSATTDAISDPTDFFFDALVLEATVCP